MTDLVLASIWEAGIRQIETIDPVVGGPPNSVTLQGIDNIALQQLGNRTVWLRDRLLERYTKSEVDALIAGASMTGAQILALLLPLDGPGSGLNADLLDGKHASAFQEIMAGMVVAWPGPAIPTGWLECNGAGISRSAYSGLFAAIGTTYGSGNGSTTFNIPDYRGVVLRGFDHGRGLDPGRTLGSYQADAFGSHAHGINPPQATSTTNGSHTHTIDPPIASTSADTHNHGVPSAEEEAGEGGFEGGAGPGSYHNLTTSDTHSHTVNIPAFSSHAAGNHAHTVNVPAFTSAASGSAETRSKNVSTFFIIRY